MNLYQQTLMDHYRYPRNRGVLHTADFNSRIHNPSCGDSISMQGCIEGTVLKRVAFEGVGCVISQAAASLLTEAVINRSVDEIMSLDSQSIQIMLGMELGPVRFRCALLPLQALQEGLAQYIKSKDSLCSTMQNLCEPLNK
jgi:nitrogen fixation NifU-like protein